ncbi:MAG: winged helix-turn-helix domain-containing protein [Pyrinomonadaceae bacterium]|nr:winged helix-turn-helix domain-containing protein [Pyrinomonadaceae bacterium]
METSNGHQKIVFGEFRLEGEARTLWRDKEEIHLARRPFEVLRFLIENRERVVSRNELFDKFWDGHDVYDDALRQTIGAIRHTLDDTKKPPRFIETRYGIGYRFIGAVSEEEAEKGRKGDEEKKTVGSNGWQLAERANGSEPANNKGQRTKDENQIPHSAPVKRPVFFTAFAVCLISLLALSFFAYRRQTSNAAPKMLVESIAAKRSIAILPLVNLTGDAANDYLSDGITESLINEVSRIESLKVISRSSAFQFKDKNASAQEIGEKLGVETILEGSLKQSGDRLRVEARLVNAKDGSVFWASDSQERKPADVFAIQDGIVCQLVTELKVKLCGEVAPSERYTKNVKAYQLYLQGLYYRNRLGAEDLKKAIDFYNQALQIDPNYALAHEGLASVYAVMELNSMAPPGSVAPLAELHANKALELDDSLAGAYLALGVVKTLQNYDLAERERYYRQALLKNPNHRTAHLWLSNIYTARGEFEKAEAEALRAQEIDPLSFGVRLTLEDLYFYWRKPDKTIEQAELVLVAEPDNQQAFAYLAQAYAQKGNFAKAFAICEKLSPEISPLPFVLAAAGRAGETRKFAEAYAQSDGAKNNPYYVARGYALSGDKETAFAWLEKSYAARQADLISLKIDPYLDNLRDDARYQDLLRRVHLAD